MVTKPSGILGAVLSEFELSETVVVRTREKRGSHPVKPSLPPYPQAAPVRASGGSRGWGIGLDGAGNCARSWAVLGAFREDPLSKGVN